jgi:hypothetical protein
MEQMNEICEVDKIVTENSNMTDKEIFSISLKATF